jgi:hypothetical protein
MLVNSGAAKLGYGAGMVSMLIRLLTLASFLLMPLGLVSAPTAAADRTMVGSSMPCDGHQQPLEEAPQSTSHCAACVALAQGSYSAPANPLKPSPLLVDRSAGLLLGPEPEVATPPPKPA